MSPMILRICRHKKWRFVNCAVHAHETAAGVPYQLSGNGEKQFKKGKGCYYCQIIRDTQHAFLGFLLLCTLFKNQIKSCLLVSRNQLHKHQKKCNPGGIKGYALQSQITPVKAKHHEEHQFAAQNESGNCNVNTTHRL